MAHCIIESTNPNLSFILGKNPASGVVIKEHRQGHFLGWYHDEKTFCMFFNDSDDDISYKDYEDQSFEFLNQARYNSSDIPARMITDFFNSLLNKGSDKDIDGYENSFTIGSMKYRGKGYFNIIQKFFPDFKIETSDVAHQNYTVKVTTNKSIATLLNFISVISLLSFVKEGTEFVDLDSARIKKLINQITSFNPPYFMAYIFKANLFIKERDFRDFSETLEKSCREPNVKLAKGSNYQQRIDFVGQNLDLNMNIFDFGCGEGTYIKKFASKVDNNTYFAFDIDPNAISMAQGVVKKKQLENVVFLQSNEEIEGIPEDKIQIILSEVIEHNTEDVSTEIIHSLFNKLNVSKLILTTPNKEFNKFYLLDDTETRHHDHVNEMTKEELESFMDRVLPKKYQYILSGLGDSVDGEFTTFGVIITKKEG